MPAMQNLESGKGCAGLSEYVATFCLGRKKKKEGLMNKWMDTLRVARMRLMSCWKQSLLKSVKGRLALSNIVASVALL